MKLPRKNLGSLVFGHILLHCTGFFSGYNMSIYISAQVTSFEGEFFRGVKIEKELIYLACDQKACLKFKVIFLPFSRPGLSL